MKKFIQKFYFMFVPNSRDKGIKLQKINLKPTLQFSTNAAEDEGGGQPSSNVGCLVK